MNHPNTSAASTSSPLRVRPSVRIHRGFLDTAWAGGGIGRSVRNHLHASSQHTKATTSARLEYTTTRGVIDSSSPIATSSGRKMSAAAIPARRQKIHRGKFAPATLINGLHPAATNGVAGLANHSI